MNQNDLVALGLAGLVVGGLAVFGRQLGAQPTPGPNPNPNVLPPVPNPFPPNPNPNPPAPGGDPQLEAARRTLETLMAALQAQGGGTQAQRDQAAQVLETQAMTLEATGQSPAAIALLRQSAQALRRGQMPPVPPSPNPAPTPVQPFPFPPFPNPFPVQTAPPPAGGAAASADLLRARAAITSAERQLAEAPTNPTNRQAIASRLRDSRTSYQDPAAQAEILAAAGRIAGPPGAIPSTGQAAASTPSAPSADLMTRYTELRDHCADFLQGARPIDPATLGAADRTSVDLLGAGDKLRAADLGALATASYQRAGIARPVPVTA